MPPPPEFPDRICSIGIPEIFFKMKAEHPPHSDRHITVAAKVKINLKQIGDCSQPRPQYIDPLNRRGEQRIGDHCHIVSQNRLFAKTHNKTPNPFCNVLGVGSSLCHLPLHIMVFYDWSGNELRKQRNIQQNVAKPLLRRRLPKINVHDIRHCLKGKKRNPYRQCHSRNRYMQPSPLIPQSDQKSRILKDTKQCQIDDYHHDQNPTTPSRRFFYPSGAPVMKKSRSDHQKNIYRLAIGIK